MKTIGDFLIFMLVTMTMAVAFADMTRKAPSMIPAPEEIKAVRPKIEELTRDDFKALKAKKKTSSEKKPKSSSASPKSS